MNYFIVVYIITISTYALMLLKNVYCFLSGRQYENWFGNSGISGFFWVVLCPFTNTVCLLGIAIVGIYQTLKELRVLYAIACVFRTMGRHIEDVRIALVEHNQKMVEKRKLES